MDCNRVILEHLFSSLSQSVIPRVKSCGFGLKGTKGIEGKEHIKY